MGLLSQIYINYSMPCTLPQWPVGNILYYLCTLGPPRLYLPRVWHIGQYIYALPLIPGTLSFFCDVSLWTYHYSSYTPQHREPLTQPGSLDQESLQLINTTTVVSNTGTILGIAGCMTRRPWAHPPMSSTATAAARSPRSETGGFNTRRSTV
jgi:hypothetical protein